MKIIRDPIPNHYAIAQYADNGNPGRGPGVQMARRISAGVRSRSAREDAEMDLIQNSPYLNAASRELGLHAGIRPDHRTVIAR